MRMVKTVEFWHVDFLEKSNQILRSSDPPGQAGRRAFQVGGNRHTTPPHKTQVSVAAQTIDKDGGQRRRA